jgi:hypothetical protein
LAAAWALTQPTKMFFFQRPENVNSAHVHDPSNSKRRKGKFHLFHFLSDKSAWLECHWLQGANFLISPGPQWPQEQHFLPHFCTECIPHKIHHLFYFKINREA